MDLIIVCVTIVLCVTLIGGYITYAKIETEKARSQSEHFRKQLSRREDDLR